MTISPHAPHPDCTYAVNTSPSGGELVVLSAGFHEMNPHGMIRPFAVNRHYLYFVDRGAGVYSGRAGTYRLCAGESYIAYPNDPVGIRTGGDPMLYRFVSFEGSRAGPILDSVALSETDPHVKPKNRGDTAIWFGTIHTLLREKEGNYELKAGAYLRLILDQLTERPEQVDAYLHRLAFLSPNAIDRRIHSLIEWMSAHYADEITVKRLAGMTGYSERYFRKAFRKATGVNPMEFLLRIRAERAVHLLFQPLSIQQIARAVGYRDPYYFSRQFKLTTGLSPSRYREYAKQKLSAGEPL